MQVEKTLSIIKPDAVAKDIIGEIYGRFERAGLKIVAAKMKHLTRAEAEEFYAVARRVVVRVCPRLFLAPLLSHVRNCFTMRASKKERCENAKPRLERRSR